MSRSSVSTLLPSQLHPSLSSEINIDLHFKDEEGLAVALDPQYRHCNKKRVLGAVSLDQPVDNYLVTRRDSGLV
jgi:hypothetical protein